jgi:uncharacterized protein YkwD
VLRRSHVCLLFAAGFLVFSAAPSALAAKQRTESSSRGSLLQAVNAARTSHGLQPLHLDPELERAAQAHTLEMLRGNTFSHGDFSGRMAAFHLHGALGENLAWGSGRYSRAQTIVGMWLASPGHRANLLRPGFRRIGLGLASGSFQGAAAATIVTADFGS